MKVFISWSGDLSRALAVELRQWLPMVVHQVDAWISGRDIGPGQRWALALGRELAESHFGIICLTAENLESPWILFEAGALARSLEARVVPLLFGIKPSDLAGPLAQFQSVEANRAGIERLVADLYDAGRSALDAHQKDLVYTQLWPILAERLRELADQAGQHTLVQSPADLLSELAKSPEQLPTTVSEDKSMLERIAKERERLRRELEYLENEEAKLTQHDAPISLQERAIEPTQHRLAEVESTVSAVLDRVFTKLTPSQIALVQSLVTPPGAARVLLTKEQTGRHADLEALSRLGLVTIGQDGAMISHDLVAEYVARRFGAHLADLEGRLARRQIKDLSEAEQDILRAALPTGAIYLVGAEQLIYPLVRTGYRGTGSQVDPEALATYWTALQHLVELGLVEQSGETLYRLTSDGFTFAKRLVAPDEPA